MAPIDGRTRSKGAVTSHPIGGWAGRGGKSWHLERSAASKKLIMTDALIVSTARTGLAIWRGALSMTHGATMAGTS
jgi:hypothetical protein